MAGSVDTPGAPAAHHIPLPSNSATPPIAPPAQAQEPDKETDVSYISISNSDKKVFARKYNRFRSWAQEVTGLGGIRTPESRMGGAVGAGSAVWSDQSRRTSERAPAVAEPKGTGMAMPVMKEEEEGPEERSREVRTALSVEEKRMGSAAGTPRPLGTARSRSPATTVRATGKAVASDLQAATRPGQDGPSRPRLSTDPPVGSLLRQRSRDGQSRKVNGAQTSSLDPAAANRSIPRKPSMTAKTSPLHPLQTIPANNRSSPSLNKATPPAPGDLLSPYPPSGTTRAQREAYISSALSLPLDMLSEVNMPPGPRPSIDSTQLSGVRLRSLLSQRSSPAMGVREVDETPRKAQPSNRAVSAQNGNTARPLREKSSKANIAAQAELVSRTRHDSHDSNDHPAAKSKERPTQISRDPTPTALHPKGSRPHDSDANGIHRATANSSLPVPTTVPAQRSQQGASECSRLVQPLDHQLSAGAPVRNLGSNASRRSQRPEPARPSPAAAEYSSGHLAPADAVRQLGSQGSQPSQRSKHAQHQQSGRQMGSQGSHQSAPRPIDPGFGVPVVKQSPPDDNTIPRGMGSQGSQRTHRSSAARPRLGEELAPPVQQQQQEQHRQLGSQGSHRSVSQPADRPARNEIPISTANGAVRSLGSRGSQRDRQRNDHDYISQLPYLTSGADGPVPVLPPQQKDLDVPHAGSHGSSRTHHQQQHTVPSFPEVFYTPPDSIEPARIPLPQTATTISRPSTHRQQLPLPRPAISRNGSSSKQALRPLRQPSLSNLRFDPATYPLPVSVTSAERSESVVLSPVRLVPDVVPFVQPGGASPRPVVNNMNLTGHTVVYAPNSNVHLDGSPDRSASRVTSGIAREEESKTTPRRSRPPSAEQPSPTARSTPRSPLSGPDATPRPIPESSPTIPAIILPSGPAENIRSPDAEHLSFEVPSGNRGRLRVSLAWFRDGGRAERRGRGDAAASVVSSVPPPVPPKSPTGYGHRSLAGRVREHFSPRSPARGLEEDREARTSRRHRRDDRSQRSPSPHGRSRRGSPQGHDRPPLSRSRGSQRSPHKEEDKDDDSDGETWRDQLQKEKERAEDLERSRSRSPRPDPLLPPPGFPYWNGNPMTPFSTSQIGFGTPHRPQGFAYPQPMGPNGVFNPWNARAGMGMGMSGLPGAMLNPSQHPSRAGGSRAPPSPPRPPSIDPPSDRDSPPAAPAPLPVMNGFPNGMMGMNPSMNQINNMGNMGAKSAHADGAGNGWQGPWWNQRNQRQDQGGFSRFFGRRQRGRGEDERRDQREEQEERGTIARWARGVKRDDAANVRGNGARSFARTRALFGGGRVQDRQDEDTRRWERLFARRGRGDRREGGDVYYGQQNRNEPPSMSRMASGVGMGLGSTRQVDRYGRSGNGPSRYNDYDARRREQRDYRREQKEIRRREKAERRDRRAERSRERERRNNERRDQPRRMNGFGATGLMNGLVVPHTNAPRDGRIAGFRLREAPQRVEERPQRRGLSGLTGFRNRNNAWGNAGVPRGAVPPQEGRGRSRGMVQNWVGMLRPGTGRTRRDPISLPTDRNVSQRVKVKDGRVVRMEEYHGVAGTTLRTADRPDVRRRLSSKKWSERAREKRRR